MGCLDRFYNHSKFLPLAVTLLAVQAFLSLLLLSTPVSTAHVAAHTDHRQGRLAESSESSPSTPSCPVVKEDPDDITRPPPPSTPSAGATPGAASASASGPADCDNVSYPDFNPHTRPSPPSERPWFEGWYARATDAAAAQSFGIVMGHFPDQNLSDPRAMCFMLVAPTSGGPLRIYSRSFDSLRVESPLQGSATGTTTGTANGDANASTNSTYVPVSFSLMAMDNEDSLDFCDMTVTPRSVDIHARVKGTTLRVRSESTPGANGTATNATCTAAEPWGGPEAPSPEAWVARLGFMLRLRYGVLTLRTPVEYVLHESGDVAADGSCPGGARGAGQRGDGDVIVGGRREAAEGAGTGSDVAATPPAPPPPVPPLPPPSPPPPVPPLPPPSPPPPVPPRPPRPPRPPPPPPLPWRPALLHMEKNWGESFPDQWVWAQGHGSAAGAEASFVLAGGLLPHMLQPLVPAVRMFVFSYHPPPPAQPFTVDPRDPALFSSLVVQGCDGTFTVDLYCTMYVVRLVASAPPSSFSALPCPTATGFRNTSVESFVARVQLRVLRRPFPFAPAAAARLLFEDTFEGAAMEFGGAFVCPRPQGMTQLGGVEGLPEGQTLQGSGQQGQGNQGPGVAQR